MLKGKDLESKALNKELKDLENELKENIDKLEKSNQELEQFAYIASHDLQEPLRMISSFMELLKDEYYEKLDDDARQYIDFAVSNSNRLKKLIRGLLILSKVNNKIERRKFCSVIRIIKKAMEQMSLCIKEKSAVINIPKKDTLIFADEQQIIQVIQNIISNAMKFNKSKEIIININYENINGKIKFVISDNGIGIEKEFCAKIFVIFQRLNSDIRGTGIGLALCKKIIDRHNGKIWAEPQENGVKFCFELPRTQNVKTS